MYSSCNIKYASVGTPGLLLSPRQYLRLECVGFVNSGLWGVPDSDKSQVIYFCDFSPTGSKSSRTRCLSSHSAFSRWKCRGVLLFKEMTQTPKGRFASKSKTHILPLACGAIYPSGSFWCELQSFSNIKKLGGTWLEVPKKRKNT